MIEKGFFTFFKSGCCENLIYKSSENTVSKGLGVFNASKQVSFYVRVTFLKNIGQIENKIFI
jgi:hypothetical protein